VIWRLKNWLPSTARFAAASCSKPDFIGYPAINNS
jgi:hypothetical protein